MTRRRARPPQLWRSIGESLGLRDVPTWAELEAERLAREADNRHQVAAHQVAAHQAWATAYELTDPSHRWRLWEPLSGCPACELDRTDVRA